MTTMNDRANQIIPALVFEYGVFAVSVHLVTNRVVQPAIAILAIKNVNADDGGTFQCGSIFHEARVSSDGNVV
ncbi:MAG: hypothetical protein MRJ67_15280 [Nitrospirales bacterium]|nr:hypothetical protein [Nitrospirales bacterium]MDR4461857.1 hypothetical protein [Nitrospirales bacterium]